MKFQNILSIETSCDDTSISLISGYKIIKNIILSSAQIQNMYGGVVPEVAAREHEKNIINAFEQVFDNNEWSIKDIDIIAYTCEPGLRVSLNVGEAFATSLSALLNIPVKKINHIYAHIFSFYDEDNKDELEYPFLSLVASGGHTSIFLVKSPMSIEVLNETGDDAVGEVYDKVARKLSLGYPGGPVIDNMYNENKNSIKFVLEQKPESQFSFSGIKTAVLNYINQKQMKNEEIDKLEIVSSFQKQVIDIMLNKLKYYSELLNIDVVSIGGGVSANSLLQKQIKEANFRKVFIPKNKIMCGDNAAMIAIYCRLLLDSNI